MGPTEHRGGHGSRGRMAELHASQSLYPRIRPELWPLDAALLSSASLALGGPLAHRPCSQNHGARWPPAPPLEGHPSAPALPLAPFPAPTTHIRGSKNQVTGPGCQSHREQLTRFVPRPSKTKEPSLGQKEGPSTPPGAGGKDSLPSSKASRRGALCQPWQRRKSALPPITDALSCPPSLAPQ